MKVIIAPQAFKGTLSVFEVGHAIEKGVQSALPGAKTRFIPISDGGDGFMDVLLHQHPGIRIQQTVTGPVGDQIEAEWGIFEDSRTAVFELAQFAGLAMISPEYRDPLTATTRGLGEGLRSALDKGIRDFVIGIGGSCTNDAGTGIVEAFGGRFLDANGHSLPGGGASLEKLETIDLERLDPRIAVSKLVVACDVKNPMTGQEGASLVYSPQKGACPSEAKQLERALQRFVEVVHRQYGIDLNAIKGSGAAGGTAGGLHALLNAELTSGIDLVLEHMAFDEHLNNADLVVTGEGKMDAQTIYGKGPIVIAQRAKARGIPVWAFVGSLGEGYEAVYDYGITKVIPLSF